MKIVIKDRELLELLKLESLDRRLHPNHERKQMVQSDLLKLRSGRRGEREIDYPLRFLDESRFKILHSIRLPDDMGYFQIDTLLLCESYLLILEIKNWYGTILFGGSGQVTRIGDNDIEEGFPNPIQQVKLQQHRLGKWLQARGTPDVPIIYLVVMSFPSTIIKSTSPTQPIPEQVIHNNELFFTIQTLDRIHIAEKLSIKWKSQLADELIKAHTPPARSLLSKYQIRADELLTGVFCPKCFAVPMIRKRQKWNCTICNHSSTYAHLEAFNDYKLLISYYVANREMRHFLQVESPDVVKKLLQKEQFQAIGNTRNRKYKLKLSKIE